jgi:hypothetical protein
MATKGLAISQNQKTLIRRKIMLKRALYRILHRNYKTSNNSYKECTYLAKATLQSIGIGTETTAKRAQIQVQTQI